jgi:predicted RNA-binding Zn ribbon-like protein
VVSTTDASAAPNQLDLVIDFVNTLDVEEGTDELATADRLTTWLAQRGVLEPSGAGPPSDMDLQQAIRLREALRQLMLANNGGTRDDGAGEELERVARLGDLRVQFDGGGSISIVPGAEGVAAALARVLVPVAHAVGDGSWQRVKACRADDCHWAFYDRSRNRSGVWCEMAVCGNRTKVRAYRERAPGEGH